MQGYVNTAKKFSSDVLCKSPPDVGSIGRLAHSSDDVEKVKRVHPCKYLHLGSKHNTLAREIETHIKSNGNGLVQVNNSFYFIIINNTVKFICAK